MRMAENLSRAFLAIAAAGLIAIFILFGSDYGVLPATVPTHFDAVGAPNGWGSKTSLVILPAVATLFFLLFGLFAPATASLRRPVPPAVPALMRLIGAEAVWMFYFIESDTLATALGRGHGLTIGFFAMIGSLICTSAATAIYGVAWAARTRSS
jgi:hypothetical protein